ncbi:hypothetical protein [Auritidibacter ignavus]|uniref:hypothetical protein n=1 Tax=Auritidibacter ignavus TaxID=678932 RepID=UPI000F0223FA|nr:hypothetical protein [Auritidibacter ignavus]NIH72782.1 hypothetical protein [Auritidibacter ignavus]RMX21173.1 hypothetical protein DYI20_12050 [Auritidibacter ignavus]
MSDAFESLWQFTASQPIALQCLIVLLTGAIPFLESYYGSVIGIIAGVPALLAIPAAITGNMASTIGVIYVIHLRQNHRQSYQGHSAHADATEFQTNLRNPKLRRRFEKYGIAGVSLGSQVILPSQITAATLIRAGMPIRKVALWQGLSITLWGILYGSLAAFGIGLLT